MWHLLGEIESISHCRLSSSDQKMLRLRGGYDDLWNFITELILTQGSNDWHAKDHSSFQNRPILLYFTSVSTEKYRDCYFTLKHMVDI